MPMTDDRLKLWLDFSKVVIPAVFVTGILGFAGQWMNADYQERQIKGEQLLQKTQIETERLIQQTKLDIEKEDKRAQIEAQIIGQEKDYLTSFLQNALDENTERKYQFALFFKSLSVRPERS